MKYDPELVEGTKKITAMLKEKKAKGSILLGDDSRGKYVLTIFNQRGEIATKIGGTRNEIEGVLSGITIGLLMTSF